MGNSDSKESKEDPVLDFSADSKGKSLTYWQFKVYRYRIFLFLLIRNRHTFISMHYFV